VSLCGGDLLVDGVRVGLLVFDSVEVLAVDVGEGGAVAGVAEEQVEHGPDERQAAGLAGEAADHLGPSFDLAEGAFEQVGSWYERRRMSPRALDRDVAAVERFGLGEYGATVRDRGIREQTQVGQAVPERCASSASL
jgi:hypothetical protein